MAMPLLLIIISEARAHEGHSHPLGGIPLWQIVVVVGLAVGVYVGFKTWRKRRTRQHDER
jgi:hypothetical protein